MYTSQIANMPKKRKNSSSNIASCVLQTQASRHQRKNYIEKPPAAKRPRKGNGDACRPRTEAAKKMELPSISKMPTPPFVVRATLGPQVQPLLCFIRDRIAPKCYDSPCRSRLEKILKDGDDCSVDEQFLRRAFVAPHSRLPNAAPQKSISKSVSPSNEDIHTSNHPVCASSMSVVNPYKTTMRSRTHAYVAESIESLVDGVISQLVHKECRQISASKSNHNHQLNKCNLSLLWKERQKYANILSLGYALASDRRGTVTRSCTNMAPGIVCNHPNTTVSFVKNNGSIKLLHSLVGDDLMREMLLFCYVLVPVGDSQRHNYYQICGPPLHGNSYSSFDEDNLSDSSSSGIGNEKQALEKESRKDLVSVNEPLPRYRIFYADSFVKKIGLPPSHLLNRSDVLDVQLLDSLVHLRKPDMKNKKALRRKRWKRLKESGIHICKELRRRHSKCDYARMLERHCPLPASFKNSGESDSHEHTLSDLIALDSPSIHAANFVVEALKTAFPNDFWGSQSNFKVFSEAMRKFVLMRRNERMPIKEVTKGVRVTDFLWLCAKRKKNSGKQRLSLSDHEALTRLSCFVLRWVCCHFVIPLLRVCFYITETEFSKNRILFYRKPVWSKLRKLSIEHLLQQQYTEIDGSTEVRKRMEIQTMGCSMLRILPKKNGIRAIATLSKRRFVEDELEANAPQNSQELAPRKPVKRKISDTRYLSTNMILNQTFDVLKYEFSVNPESFGSGILGSNQLYPKLYNFVKDLELNAKNERVKAPLYFASVDIHHCYDTINQKHLYDVMNNILSEDEYLTQKYNVLHPFQSLGRVQSRYRKKVGAPETFEQFYQIADKLASRHSQSIFVDGVNCGIMKKDRVFELLREHIFRNIAMMNDSFFPRFFLQSDGVPQGSVLSSFFCNFFYGDLEKDLLQDVFITADNSSGVHLLVRIVDDFLLVTNDKGASERFLKKMQEGIPEMGVKVNPAKTLVNFDVELKASDGTSALASKCKKWFPWCGMLIDTETCEVQLDYSRFAGSLAHDSLTVDLINEGAALKLRMKTFVRPRCQSIFFDSFLNKKATIERNLYQALTLTAVKTVGYIDCMPGGPACNENYIYECIEDVISYAFQLIRRRLINEIPQKSVLFADQSSIKSPRGEFGDALPKSRAIWLGRHAFQSVLQKRRDDYKIVLQKLNQKLSNHKESSSLKRIARESLKLFDLSRFQLQSDDKVRK